MRSLSGGARTYTIHRLAVSDETPIEVGESQEPLNLGDSLKYVIFPLLNCSGLGRVLVHPSVGGLVERRLVVVIVMSL